MIYLYHKKAKRAVHLIDSFTDRAYCQVENAYTSLVKFSRSDHVPEGRDLCLNCLYLYERVEGEPFVSRPKRDLDQLDWIV